MQLSQQQEKELLQKVEQVSVIVSMVECWPLELKVGVCYFPMVANCY